MFRHFLSIAILTIPLLGCSAIRDEFNQPDGAVGPYLNNQIPAATRISRADRYLIGLMILAPLALETSAPGDDTSATIRLVNRSYDALATLYSSTDVPKPTAPEASKFSFETAAYDVQKADYRLIKTIAINLDIDEAFKEAKQLDIKGLIKLAKRAQKLMPPARRGAATYRDAIILFASAVNDSCAKSESCAAKPAKERLADALKHLPARTSGLEGDAGLDRLLGDARSLAWGDAKDWKLSKEMRMAALYHVKRACDVANKVREDNSVTCEAGEKYNALVKALKETQPRS